MQTIDFRLKRVWRQMSNVFNLNAKCGIQSADYRLQTLDFSFNNGRKG